MSFSWPAAHKRTSDVLWLDLGDFGDLVRFTGYHEKWQDHGLGLLRTVLHNDRIPTDVLSTRAMTSWDQLRRAISGYKTLIMNVRSYTFPMAFRSARIFKQENPGGAVLTGGMHATVAVDEMKAVEEFDKICIGPGEKTIVALVQNPEAFPRVFHGRGAESIAEWPMMDRTLWPKPGSWRLGCRFNWPLEPEVGWGPGPVATVITSRVCPWQCSFCNENSYIPNMGRKPVDMLIDELNFLDRKFGVGSVVIHDSMFFQKPSWLEEFLEKYPRKARKTWPYWAAARSDTVRQWPELFESLVRETNWSTVSIGFESGSDRVLRILNKECSEEDNDFTIATLNRIGDDLEKQGKEPPKFWANIMLAIPGEADQDAFKTMAMLKRMKRVIPSIAYYAPYPGSALGHQLIAEGKSLMTKDNYHRFASDKKVKGMDYGFYRKLLAGKYESEVNRLVAAKLRSRSGALSSYLTKA